MSKKDDEKQEALKVLKKLCRPGTTIYTCLRHVSRSGMSRRISVHVIREKELRDITWYASKVLSYPLYNRGERALVVGGCGMDMGYSVVNNLSYALHGRKDRGDAITDRNACGMFLGKVRPGHYRAGYSLHHKWV